MQQGLFKIEAELCFPLSWNCLGRLAQGGRAGGSTKLRGAEHRGAGVASLGPVVPGRRLTSSSLKEGPKRAPKPFSVPVAL